MLIPIKHDDQRLWVDLSFGYEKHIYVGSTAELSLYLLTNARVDGILSDEEVTPDVTRAVTRLVDEGVDWEDVISQVSDCYGIPADFVEGIVSPVGA